MMMDKICVTLPEKWIEKLRRKSVMEDRTVSYTIRKMLEKQMETLE